MARDATVLWSIEAAPPEGGRARIDYVLSADPGEVLFRRELSYAMPSRWLDLMDRVVIRKRMQRESALALKRLKQNLESAAGAPADGASAAVPGPAGRLRAQRLTPLPTLTADG